MGNREQGMGNREQGTGNRGEKARGITHPCPSQEGMARGITHPCPSQEGMARGITHPCPSQEGMQIASIYFSYCLLLCLLLFDWVGVGVDSLQDNNIKLL